MSRKAEQEEFESPLSAEEQQQLEAEQREDMARDYAAVLELLHSDDKLAEAWAQVEVQRQERLRVEKVYALQRVELEAMKREAAKWKKKALAAIGMGGKA